MTITPFSKKEKRRWHNSLPPKTCGAGVVLINQHKQLLAVKATYKHCWSLPGGTVDENESPKQAAIRELKEEVGIAVDPVQVHFRGVTYFHASDGFKDNLYFIFSAHVETIEPQIDRHEIEHADWLSAGEFRQRILPYHTHLQLVCDMIETPQLTLLYREGE